MSTVFVLLFLLFLVFLVWGVANPASLSQPGKPPVTRKSAGLTFGFLALVCIILGGVTAPDSTSTKNVAIENSNATLAQTDTQNPVATTKIVTETMPVPFERISMQDGTRPQGSSAITTTGVEGVKTLTFETTLVDGKQTNKKLIKEEITTQPISEVTSVGAKVAQSAPRQQAAPAPSGSSCDPNYSGACVPVASDVDCGSGSGNGPAYVYGAVRVIGSDIYDLDRDGNGFGCE